MQASITHDRPPPMLDHAARAPYLLPRAEHGDSERGRILAWRRRRDDLDAWSRSAVSPAVVVVAHASSLGLYLCRLGADWLAGLGVDEISFCVGVTMVVEV